MPHEIINNALAFISNKFEDLKKSFITNTKTQTGVLENIKGEIEAQTESLISTISKIGQKDRSSMNALEQMVSELSEVVSKLGRKEGNVVSSLDQLISELEILGNKMGIEINLNPLLEELKKQKEILIRIENKKQDISEIIHSNELLGEILKMAREKPDLSILNEIKESIALLPERIAEKNSFLESYFNKIELLLQKKTKILDSIKLDERQFKELAGSMRFGGINTTDGGEAYTTIRDGRQTVTTPGTAVALSTQQIRVRKVEVSGLLTNQDLIVVGASTVIAAASGLRGTPLMQLSLIHI